MASFTANFPGWVNDVKQIEQIGEAEILVSFKDNSPAYKYGFKGETELYLERVKQT